MAHLELMNPPWEVGSNNIETTVRNFVTVLDSLGIPVAYVADPSHAKAIAAIPELVDTLSKIVSAMSTRGYQQWWSGWDGLQDKAISAIAKARGGL